MTVAKKYKKIRKGPVIPRPTKNINTDFYSWFIGFVEGDGSFIVSKSKVYFDVTQSLKDLKILYYIKKELGFGKIIKREDRQVGQFYVTGKTNFLRLVLLFNGNLRSEAKRLQFKKWLETFNSQYEETITYLPGTFKPTLQDAWLSGFIDAEGSFIGRLRNSKTSISGKEILITFSIGQKDSEILEKIKILFITKPSKFSYIRYDRSWDGYEFYLSNKKLLKPLINYLTRFRLKTIKQYRYYHWFQLYKLSLDKNLIKTPEGVLKISDQITKINIKR